MPVDLDVGRVPHLPGDRHESALEHDRGVDVELLDFGRLSRLKHERPVGCGWPTGGHERRQAITPSRETAGVQWRGPDTASGAGLVLIKRGSDERRAGALDEDLARARILRRGCEVACLRKGRVERREREPDGSLHDIERVGVQRRDAAYISVWTPKRVPAQQAGVLGAELDEYLTAALVRVERGNDRGLVECECPLANPSLSEQVVGCDDDQVRGEQQGVDLKVGE